ncbi:hypothetical protein H8K33_11070 [Undibacterium amnicola]|uniref:Uncharacterized protein n=1 Tax=Undibacterium amnicola TaxID=1834038 RepID=A0ABR6XRG0_9BURK|nr:hypothetical protein [Undibacterium amnicola]MBC3832052.1 hypothetical protein [Undibacterium amnicola]
MTDHRLSAGTDIAEMALFDTEAIPRTHPLNEKGLHELEASKHLIRLPTGADGGYLLHLYINEFPPEKIMQYCLTDDKLTGEFSSLGGRIAFGGVESTFQEFKPNPLIRSDMVIPAGNYAYTAYRTDIPDEIVNEAIQVASTARERWLDRVPLMITLATFGIAFGFAAFKNFLAAGIVLVLGHVSFKFVKSLPDQGALAARREKAQEDFPSIVIELRANIAVDRNRE